MDAVQKVLPRLRVDECGEWIRAEERLHDARIVGLHLVGEGGANGLERTVREWLLVLDGDVNAFPVRLTGEGAGARSLQVVGCAPVSLCAQQRGVASVRSSMQVVSSDRVDPQRLGQLQE